MYESHFGFSSSPFQLNPDPAFYYDSRGHSNALAYLKFGAHQGEGFIVVTGEIGAGKTTLVRTLLEGLNPDQVVAAQVVSTQLESGELLQAILMAFGVASNSTSKAHLIASLEAFLTALAAKGRRALLIIDEAQNLKHEAVEELRMLSNFQLGKYGLLQSFLVGQPELRVLLQSKSMEQLRQRVIASCHLGPLDQAETRAYVEHRLHLVGWKEKSPVFAPAVLDRVHYWTGGVPRRINRLCNRLLLGAFLANANVISAAMVDETALELKNEIGEAVTAINPPSLVAEPTSVSDHATASLAPSQVTSSQSNAEVGSDPDMPSAEIAVTAVKSDPALPAVASTVESTNLRSDAPITPRGQGAPADVVLELAVHPQNGNPATQLTPKLVRRIHQPTALENPLLCLIDSAADYLKAGVLAEVFRSFPSLPAVVALHTGTASQLGIDDLDELQMPLPAMGLHLGVLPGSYADQISQVLSAYDAVLNELEPCAVMVMGSSDSALACSLLTRRRGLRLIRTGSGKRDPQHGLGAEAIAVLIEKMSDLHYADSTESFYALYREGIRLDRVHSVGNLSREVLDLALIKSHSRAASNAATGLDRSMTAAPYGLITVDFRTRFVQAPDIAEAIEVFDELSQELPMLWPMPTDALRLLERSVYAESLKASRIVPFACNEFRQMLALLQGAKCLVSHCEGPWLEEAKLMGVPSFILPFDLAATSVAAPEESGPRGAQRKSSGAKLREQMGSAAAMVQSPEYWDAGTARRIATHLIGWLAPTNKPSAPSGLPQGEVTRQI